MERHRRIVYYFVEMNNRRENDCAVTAAVSTVIDERMRIRQIRCDGWDDRWQWQWIDLDALKWRSRKRERNVGRGSEKDYNNNVPVARK